MIILADAGSTKTHWCLMTANRQQSHFYTEGINPFFQSEQVIHSIVSQSLLPQIGSVLWAGTVTDVFFYGAGCTAEKSPLLAGVLQSFFKHARIAVRSDMLGAARGVLGQERGIACILGTGSNSAYYDGEDIVWSVPALGYILGDEGSGAVLGKTLVADLLKNQLPAALKEQFFSRFSLTQADIIERVYRQPLPNRFLASVSVFCHEELDHPAIKALVTRHFQSFVERNILQYVHSDEEPLPIGMVGSIAYFYQEIVCQVMESHHLPVPIIRQEPMEGLCRYHLKDLQPTQV